MGRPPTRPRCPHLGLVLQGHVRGQQGHDRVSGRDVPLADLRTGVEVDQRGDTPKLLLGDAARVDLRRAGGSGHTARHPPTHPPPPTARSSAHLSQLGLDDALALSGERVLQQGVQVGPEHAAAQAGLEL